MFWTLLGLLCLIVVVCAGIWLMFRHLDDSDHEGIINIWHNQVPSKTMMASDYLRLLPHPVGVNN